MDIAKKLPEKIAGRAFWRYGHATAPKDLLADDAEDNLRHPIALIGFIFFGSYNALIWLFRNYETWQERAAIKLLASFSFVILQSFTMLALFALFSTLPNSWLIRTELFAGFFNTMVFGPIWVLGAAWEIATFYIFVLPAALLGTDIGIANTPLLPTLTACECDRVNSLTPHNYTSAAIIATITTYFAFMGTALVDALQQRRMRARAWAAIASNKQFLSERGLQNHNTISIRDGRKRQYTVKTLREDSFELFQTDAPDNRMLLVFNAKSGRLKEWGRLQDLRPDLAKRLDSTEPPPKGLPRHRAKFPRVVAPKKTYRVTNFGIRTKP